MKDSEYFVETGVNKSNNDVTYELSSVVHGNDYTYGLYNEPHAITYKKPLFRSGSNLVGVTKDIIYVIKNTMSERQILKILDMAAKETEGSFKLRTAKYAKDKLVKLKFDWDNGKGSKKQLAYESNKGINPICLTITDEDINIGSCTVAQLSAQDGDVYTLSTNQSSFVLPAMNDAGTDYNRLMQSKPEPLLIVDGVKLNYRDINNINPTLIESVSVLKDENATSKYGSDGKNGVVIVTMKKQDSESSIDASPRRLVVLDGVILGDDIKEKVWNDGESVVLRVLEREEAINKYGSKGQNGVVEMTTKSNITNTNSGYLYTDNGTFFYVTEDNTTLVYNRWGMLVMKLDAMYTGQPISGKTTLDDKPVIYEITADNKFFLKDKNGNKVVIETLKSKN